ncbi:MAG TPA: Xaa-Pro peptidase family protein [Gaiellaceae bacterium]|nr:Xaa-Pro peptidase family protein [Gaiellaceae bacterium]
MEAVTGDRVGTVPVEDVERRYRLIREAMDADGIDAVVVAGSEYSGFEGAVTYLSGFVIVHRYACVLLPREGDPAIVFPREARYVGEHGTTWIDEQVFVDRPGEWLADRLKGKRVGVYGLEYAMTVRDYQSLAPAAELVPWDEPFDHARAVKSAAELASVRDSVRINTEGFRVFLDEFAPGRTEREILAPCEEYFVAQGCGRQTMDMVLVGENGSALPEFKIAGTRRVKPTDMMLPSLEVAGPGGHWVEVSRAICPGEPSTESSRMLEAYEEYFEAARGALREGATAHDVHRAVARGFVDRGFHLGHVTGHSIGMTMIEFPKIGEGDETVLRENMVFSMHPHAISEDGRACLYMQDTWLVTARGGVPLAELPMRIYDGTERRT